MSGAIIFVDDEKPIREAARQSLTLAGFDVQCLSTVDEAIPVLSSHWPGIVVTDVRMPGTDGFGFLTKVLEIDPDLPVVLVTGHGDVAMAVRAMRAGAYDFLEKPFAPAALVDTVRRAIEKRLLVLENRELHEKIRAQPDIESMIVGGSRIMRQLRETIRDVARTDSDVLVVGETGTGKELVARYLHSLTWRREYPFVAINCGAIPETIIESELFGHEPGAFTGAGKRRIGKFEHADGGCCLLDEIESMPISMQVKLLRVLQDRVVERLGSNTPVSFDVRIIAATKEDLREASTEGRFRDDLYYRLNVLQIVLPPLRERREDIPLLFQHFVSACCDRRQIETPLVESDAIRELMAYEWPGNVRELRNVAERFVLSKCSGRVDWRLGDADGTDDVAPGLVSQLEAFEKHVIQHELARQHGNVKATYEALQLPRKTLYDKMRRYKLNKADFLDSRPR